MLAPSRWEVFPVTNRRGLEDKYKNAGARTRRGFFHLAGAVGDVLRQARAPGMLRTRGQPDRGRKLSERFMAGCRCEEVSLCSKSLGIERRLTRKVGSTSGRYHILRAALMEVVMALARRTWIGRYMIPSYGHSLPFTRCDLYAVKNERLLSSPSKEIFCSVILDCRRLL